MQKGFVATEERGEEKEREKEGEEKESERNNNKSATVNALNFCAHSFPFSFQSFYKCFRHF